MPKNKPSIVDIPTMNYIAVRGSGNLIWRVVNTKNQ